jgi:hypothetical protein
MISRFEIRKNNSLIKFTQLKANFSLEDYFLWAIIKLDIKYR